VPLITYIIKICTSFIGATQSQTLEIISSSTLFGFFQLDANAMSFFFSFQNYSLRTFFFLGSLLLFYFSTLPCALFLLYISLFTTLLEAPPPSSSCTMCLVAFPNHIPCKSWRRIVITLQLLCANK
jgi:hypothetical protein